MGEGVNPECADGHDLEFITSTGGGSEIYKCRLCNEVIEFSHAEIVKFICEPYGHDWTEMGFDFGFTKVRICLRCGKIEDVPAEENSHG
jgi:Fe2+ or Zn2+ uptake regulation protein